MTVQASDGQYVDTGTVTIYVIVSYCQDFFHTNFTHISDLKHSPSGIGASGFHQIDRYVKVSVLFELYFFLKS